MGDIADKTRLTLAECFPSRCPMCNSTTSGGFCTECQKYLSRISAACSVCGSPYSEYSFSESVNLPEAHCGRCQTRPPAQDESVVALAYGQPVSYYIQALKYNKELAIADALARILCTSIEKSVAELPEIIVPIPLHKNRLKSRGFNHSLEISRFVATYFALNIDNTILLRNRDTISQTTLNEAQRRRNLKNAFSVRQQPDILYRHIALVDDVITSGSTTNEAAKTLKKSGVQKVSVWAIAKTVS